MPKRTSKEYDAFTNAMDRLVKVYVNTSRPEPKSSSPSSIFLPYVQAQVNALAGQLAVLGKESDAGRIRALAGTR